MLIPILALACCLFLLIWFRPGDSLHQKVYWAGLVSKIAGAGVLGLVYTQWKPDGDMLYFYRDAHALWTQALTHPGDYLSYLYQSQLPHYEAGSRNGFFIKILSMILLLSNGNFWIAGLFLAMISFAGAWFLVRSLSNEKVGFLIASASFLFLPSLVLWASGITKETLLCAALFYLIGIGIRYHKGGPITFFQVLVTVLALFLLVKIRYFLFGIVILGYLTLILHQLNRIPLPRFLKITGVVLLGSLSVYFVSKLNFNLNFNHLPQSVFDNNTQILSASAPGYAMTFPLAPTWKSILLNIPLGFASGIFRPFPGEGPFIYFFAQLESFLLIVGIGYTLVLVVSGKQRVPLSLLLVCALVFILILASLTALTTPNFGTLIRYRSVYFPLAFYLSWILPFTQFFFKKAE